MTLLRMSTMEDNVTDCVSNDSWKTVYTAFKQKVADTNTLIEKFNAVTQDNVSLGKKVHDITALCQSLKSDCEKYEKDLQSALQGQEPLKQLCVSLRDQLQCRAQEKEVLENALESYKASMKQYEDLLKQKQQEVQSAQATTKVSARGKSDAKEKVSALEKKIQQGTKEYRQLQRKCIKAHSLFRILDEKLSKKGLLTVVEKRQLKRGLSVLEPCATESDDARSEDDSLGSDEGGGKVTGSLDAEYLEKLLMNGHGNCSSTSEDGLTVVHDGARSTRKVALGSHQDEVQEGVRQTPRESDKPKEAANCEGNEARVGRTPIEKGTTDASEKEQGQVCRKDSATESLEGQHSDVPLETVLDSSAKGSGGSSDCVGRSEPCSTGTPSAIGSSGGDKPVEHGSESREHNVETPDTRPADCNMNEKAPVGSPRREPIECAPSRTEREQICAPAGLTAPLQTASVPAAPQTGKTCETHVRNTGKRRAEECEKSPSGEGDMESVRAELEKIASEMHLTQLCSIPLSPLPPSPPMFDTESDMEELASLHGSASGDDSPALDNEYKNSLASDAPPASKSSSSGKTLSLSSSDKSCHRKSRNLPFSNMLGDSSSDMVFGRRPFYHQQSEGFEPQTESTELQEPEQPCSQENPFHDPIEDRKVHATLWRHPADGVLHAVARLPPASRINTHIIPIVDLHVDPVGNDMHLGVWQVPASRVRIQSTGVHYLRYGTNQGDNHVPSGPARSSPSTSQVQPSTQRHATSSDRPIRPSSTDVQHRSSLGQKPKPPARIAPVSSLYPRSDKRPSTSQKHVTRDCLEDGPAPVSSSLFQTRPLSPLPPTPRKKGHLPNGETSRGRSKSTLPSAMKETRQRNLAAIGHVPRILEEDVGEQRQNGNSEKRRVSFGFNVSSSSADTCRVESEAVSSTRLSGDDRQTGTEEYEAPVSKKRRISLLSSATEKVPKSRPLSRMGRVADYGTPHSTEATFKDEVTDACRGADVLPSVPCGSNAGKPSTPIHHRSQETENTPRAIEESHKQCTSGCLTEDDGENDIMPLAKKRRVSHIPKAPETLQSPDVLSPLSESSFEFPPPVPASKQILVRDRMPARDPTCKDPLVRDRMPAQDPACKEPVAKDRMPARDPLSREPLARDRMPVRDLVPAPPYSVFVTTSKHNFIMARARGNLTCHSTVKGALDKLAWLAVKPYRTPEAVQNVANSLKSLSDVVAITLLSYLSNTTANPFLGYLRKEVTPPLLTPTEALLLECLEYVEQKRNITEGMFNLLLTALRARLFSSRRPKTLLGMSAYCRMIAGICKRMGDIALLRVVLWDILRLFCGNAPFLLAAIVGVWPEVLSSYQQDASSGAVRSGLRYIFFHGSHTLNSTLSAQTRTIFEELGKLHPLETHLGVSDVAQSLIDALDTATSPALDEHRDEFLLHCLVLEEVCRRSGDWQWVVSVVLKKLWVLVGKLMKQTDAVTKECLCKVITLFGGIWRRFPPEENLSSLKPYLDKIEMLLQENEIDFAVQEAFVKSVFLLPALERWESLLSVIHSWQQTHKDEVLKLKGVERAIAKRHKAAKKKAKQR